MPASVYYEKLLSLGVDGFWDAADVDSLGYILCYLVRDDLLLAVQVLEKKSDDEIASFWYFLHDDPGRDRSASGVISSLACIILLDE